MTGLGPERSPRYSHSARSSPHTLRQLGRGMLFPGPVHANVPLSMRRESQRFVRTPLGWTHGRRNPPAQQPPSKLRPLEET